MMHFFHTSPFTIYPFVLALASLLDLAIGDPGWLPHPVRGIGSAISKTERFIRKYLKTPFEERLGGIFLSALIIIPVFLITYFACGMVFESSNNIASLAGIIVLIYLTSTAIAVRELINSANAVIQSVRGKDIENARIKLSMIVGRDTRNLSDKEILKATMETLAENLSDGIIAPVFYLAAGGLPAAMTYKTINTLDSMVGYKNNKYINFGWASAKLDDLANYIPARITGALIVISSAVVFRSWSAVRYSFKIMFRDGKNHTSPNSGIPEAAMSGALGIRMGGPAIYGGVLVEKPYIGDIRTDDYLSSARNAINIVKAASLSGIFSALIILFFMEAM